MNLISIALVWILWCVLHSVLITPAVTIRAVRMLGPRAAWYRLSYNAFSVVTFAIAAWWSSRFPATLLYAWDFPWVLFQRLVMLLSLVLLYLGARQYDQRRFFGLAQIAEAKAAKSVAPAVGSDLRSEGTAPLSTGGILQHVRHPYYTSGILLLSVWPDYTDVSLVTNLILIAYLIIGAFVEERKLVAEYGDAYRAYQRRVPMLIPRLRRTTR